MRLSVAGWTAAAAVLLVAPRASAGGLEYTGAGAQALGRGGAVTARADDPMVLMYNPAGLAELRGNQLMIGANLSLMSACVDPIGYYGWGAYNGGLPSRFVDPQTGESLTLNLGSSNEGPEGAYYKQPLDTVCASKSITPVPQVGVTARLTERLGVGFGFMFPSVTPPARWGGDTGVIHTAQGLRPAATRYMQINSGTLGIFPTAGFGFRLAKWLRIGGAFEWGMINVDNLNMAGVSAGTTPACDILARVKAVDWFIPAFTGSIHLVPFDNLDIVAAFRYQGDLHAKGTIDLTTGVFDPTKNVLTKSNVVTDVEQKMPWKLRGGIRYASRLAPRPTGTGQDEPSWSLNKRIHDALEDERWDLEFDIEYQMNSRNQDQYIRYTPGQTADFIIASTGMMTSAEFPSAGRDYTQIPKRWKNQISVRAGGTYNVLPGFFGISAGAHYENRGIDPAYMQLDYWPVSRVGLHFGVIMRVSRSIDLLASYAHMFDETIVVAAPEHADGMAISAAYAAAGNNSDAIRNIDKRVGVAASRSQPAAVLEETNKPANPDATARLAQNVTKSPNGTPPFIINSGTYRSHIDVFAVGLNAHF